MPQGLQVFNENGKKIIDTNSRVASYLGTLKPTKPSQILEFRHEKLLKLKGIVVPLIIGSRGWGNNEFRYNQLNDVLTIELIYNKSNSDITFYIWGI